MATPNENPATLNENQAKAILQFLQRTQMQGSEMPAYVDVFNTLMAIVGEAAPAAAPAARTTEGLD